MNIKNNSCDVSILASKNNWIEGKAVEQLKSTASLEGMVKVVGMPDLHPGRGNPIGAAFLSKNKIYPYLVGGDIGCGMGLWRTSFKTNKAKRDKWAKKLHDLDSPWEGDRETFVKKYNLKSWDDALGTIGGGNHFAELQKVSKIVDEEIAAEYGVDGNFLHLMVHSGSRGLGQMVLNRHMEAYGACGLEAGTDEATAYLDKHNFAFNWAIANRELIAQRFLDSIHSQGHKVADMIHNSVLPCEGGWLHRKGAAPSDINGLVLIPGSRGSYSYVVKPVGGQQENCWSLAHGAGRKYHRGDARKRFRRKFSVQDLQQTVMGSKVICENKDLLYEEAPQAYKDIDIVIDDMLAYGVIKVVAILQPVITYKTRRR